MNLLEAFKNFLFSQDNKPSAVTVKNYLSDINHFSKWFEKTYQKSFAPIEVTKQTIESYKSETSQVLSASSLDRHFSSLRKFFTFLKLDGKISQSPFDQIKSEANFEIDPWHIKDFKSFLYVYNSSNLTIKNYLIDIRQFLRWAQEVSSSSEAEVLGKVDSRLIEEYKQRLLTLGQFSPSTINRKLSSLRKYTAWAGTEHLIKGLDFEAENIVEEKPEVSLPIASPVFEAITEDKPFIYSSFPPKRLIQKISQGVLFVIDASLIIPLVRLIEKTQFTFWKTQGQDVFSKAGKSINLKTPKLNLNSYLISHKNILVKNLPKELYAPLEISTANFPLYKKVWHNLKYNRPKWYKTYHSYPIAHYFNFAILIIFLSALSFGFYNAFFQTPQNQNPALAVGPTAPPRILSFQGRLTDNSDNPITATSNLRFAIYDTLAASGSSLLWQEVDPVSPDPDGIFNVILGNNTAIPATLFAQNSALYLGVTVGVTPELTPRQQLATVAFATNAEFLQGLPPITSLLAGDAKTNTVLALDSSGNLTIGGSTNPAPVFQSTDGQFTLSGKTLLLTTVAGTNTNVKISPDGFGVIDLSKPIVNTSISNNISSAKGSVEVDDSFSILASQSGQSALTINETGGATSPLISASASGVSKFTVDNSGNLSLAGGTAIDTITAGTLGIGTTNATTITLGRATQGITLPGFNQAGGVFFSNSGALTLSNIGTSSQCLLGGATPAFGACNTGVSNDLYWAQNLGALFPNNSTVDLLIGGQSTASAKFGFINVAAGTPTATISSNFSIQVPTGNSPSILVNAINGGSIDFKTATLGQGDAGLTSRFKINNNGNIGVGTSASTDLVTLGTGGILQISDSSNGFIRFEGGASGDSSIQQFFAETSWNNNTYGRNIGGSGYVYDTTNPASSINQTGGDISLRTAPSGTAGLFITWLPKLTLKNIGTLGLNTTSPLATFDIRPNISTGGTISIASVSGTTSFASLIVDQSGVGDLFAASKSGLPIFTLKKNGTLVLGAPIYQTGACTLKTDTTGLVTCGTDNTGSAGTNWWNQLAGALSPIDTTNDFLIGSTATSSALFSYTGIKTGQTIASVSGNLIVMPNNGYGGQIGIGTTAPTQALDVLGSANISTNLLFTKELAHTIQISDSTTADTVGGALTIKSGAGSATNSNGGALNLTAGAAAGNGTGGTISITSGGGANVSGAGGGAINLLTGTGRASGAISILTGNTISSAVSGTVTIQSGVSGGTSGGTSPATGTITIQSGQPGAPTTGTGGTSGAVTVSSGIGPSVGGAGSTGGGTGNLTLSTGAASAGGSGNSIGGSGGTLFITGGAGGNGSGNGAGGAGSSVSLTAGNGGTTATGTGGAAGTISFTAGNGGIPSGAGTGVIGGNITLAAGNGSLALAGGALTFAGGQGGATGAGGAVSFTTGAGGGTSGGSGALTLGTGTVTSGSFGTISLKQGANTRAFIDTSGNLGIGTTSPLATFDVRGNSATTPVASISGSTNFAALVIDQTGNGDIFTASTSGFPLFTVKKNGTLVLGAPIYQTGACTLKTDNTGLVTCGADNTGSGVNWWNQLAGALSPVDTTNDFLLGSTATSSALFSFTGVKTGQTIASVSGNLIVMANNGYGGKVGIGTSNPSSLLSLAGLTNPVITGTTFQGSSNSTISLYDPNNGDMAFQTNFSTASIRFNTAGSTTSKMIITSSGNVGIGTSSPIATLDVRGNLATTPVASISGATSFAALVIDQSGNGDLFTASASGLPLFTITKAGNLIPGTNGGQDLGSTTRPWRNIYGTTYFSGATTGVTASLGCVSSTLGIVTGSGACPASGGTSPFSESLGAIIENNTTEDLLIGGQSTASATFHVYGSNALAGTQPVASIAANTSFAGFVIDQKGVGDVFTASASGLPLFTITKAGRVGIGTTLPNAKIEILGNAGDTGLGLYSGITSGIGILLQSITTGTAVKINSLTSGSGISVAVDSLSNGNGIIFPANVGTGIAFTGNYIKMTPLRTIANTLTDTGNFINVARGITVSDAGVTYTNTGDLATLSSNCTVTSGQCIDTSHLLSLTQSYSSASGSVLFLSNAGKGLAIEANSTGNTVPVASLSGKTSFSALVVDNKGVGDLFTASASGLPLFTITQAGNVIPGTNGGQDLGSTTRAWRNVYGTTYFSGATTGVTASLGCVSSTLGIVTGSGACPISNIDTFWNQNLGALFPNNSTVDFLVGGQSTVSAKFAITGISNPNNQVNATLSGQLSVFANNGYGGNATISGALTLGAFSNATVQTTSNQQLTVGGNTTGDIQFKPGNSSSSLYLQSTGNVGIGTTNPSSKLQVAGGNILLDNNRSINFLDTDTTSIRTVLGITSTGNTFLRNGNSTARLDLRTQNDTAVLSLIDSTANIGINTTSPLSSFEIRNSTINGGTISIASVSGSTTFAALIANNNGVGDLFSASKSGLPIFTIKNNGTLVLGAPIYQTGACTLKTDNTGLVTCGTDNTGSGVNWWNQLAGALSPVDTTNDFLLGSTATSTAKFSFTGVKTGQTIASVSGNLIVMANNGYGGKVGIGTTAPTEALDVNSTAVFGGGTDRLSLSGGSIGINRRVSDGAIYDSGAYAYQFQHTKSATAGSDNLALQVYNTSGTTVTTNALVVDGNGNVGVGTSTISNKLDVIGGSLVIGSSDFAANASLHINAVFGGNGRLTQLMAPSGGALNIVSGNGGTNWYSWGVNSSANWNISPGVTFGSTGLTMDTSGNVGIGASTPLATLDVRGGSGTTPVASISGQTSFSALVVDNKGVGDLFSASESGLPLFTITKLGNVIPGTNGGQDLGSTTRAWRNVYGTTYFSGATIGVTAALGCVSSTLGIVTGSGACPGGSGTNWWNELAGALSPVNINDDFLLGSNATSSALFSYTGIKTGLTIASVSGSLIVMPNNGYGGQISVNKTSALAGVDIKDTNSLGTLGSEKITAPADQDFSSDTGKWTTTGSPPWKINIASSGKAVKDAPGTGILTLNNTALDSAPVAGKTYQIVFTFTTTASSSGSLTPQVGGTSGVAIGQIPFMNNTQTQLITATNTNALQFTPSSDWYGTLDNISIKQVSISSIALRLESSDGTSTPIEFRTGGSNKNNLFIGTNAGMSNTTGTTNTAIGFSALKYNVTGTSNTALGYTALQNNTTGGANTALGYTALQNNTTATGNTALGYTALRNNTTGTSNTALGASALTSNTTGAFNTALGESALTSNTTGGDNTALGSFALWVNTTGSNNTALGYTALQNNITGNDNNALGLSALFNNTTGAFNTALGRSSLTNNISGGNNAALGYNSGQTNSVGGSNTFLGYLADVGFGNLINAGAIGANALVSQNDSLVLGSINGVNSATGSARIGIGTTTPLVTLDVRGSSGTLAVASFSGKTSFATLVTNNDGGGDLFTASAAGTTRFVINNQGVVGIGTVKPTLASALQINPFTAIAQTTDLVNFSNVAGQEPTIGGVNALQLSWNVKPAAGNLIGAERINITNANTGTGGQAQGLRIAAIGAGTNINSDIVGLLIDSLGLASNGTRTQNAIEIGNNWDSSIYGQTDLRINAGGNIILATSSGTKVGIGFGANSPLATLDVRPNNSNGGTIAVASVSGQTSNAALIVDNSGTGAVFTASTAGLTRFTVQQNGNVAIGTTSATEKLDVNGNIKIEAAPNQITSFAKVTSATSGTYKAGGTTGIASASAMAVFNGSLYVGTGKGGITVGGAEIYRYDGTSGVWTLVSQATPGTISAAGGATTAIASVSAMAVFNGKLYAGTAKPASAEVYRYDGGTTWTRVSAPTAGTINGGGTASIDAVSSMTVMGGDLYIGTTKRSGAEVYRYIGNNTWTVLNSAAGTFVATSTDAVSSLVAYNNTLYAGLRKTGANGVVAKWGGGTGTTWTIITGAAGTVCTTNTYDVPAMIVYNGKLYASTVNTSFLANMCRYDDTQGAVSTTWTTVITSTVGTIRNGGTANITSIRSMAVYNGRLYIGTEKPGNAGAGAAEVYQYIDGVDWSVLNSTAGTVVAGGTSGVDAVSAMQPYNGSLYVGTSEFNSSATIGSEVYQYINITDQSFALKFSAFSSQTQSAFPNDGSIWFMASPSGQVNTGNTGTGSFMFSNGITTGAGSYDLAEDYPTRDSTLTPGDLVTVDPNEVNFVNKTSIPNDNKIMGVYSANPGFRLSQIDSTIDGANVIPVALTGRVLTKVTSANGNIKAGDYITSSSIPGVGAKAITAGETVGIALQDYEDGDPNNVGQIFVRVGPMWHDPDVYLKDSTGLDLLDKNASDSAYTIPHYFTLSDALGNPITKVGAFAEIAAAKLRVGFVDAQQISTKALSVATDNVTIGGQSIRNYIAGIVQDVINNTNGSFVSPIAEVDQVHTNLISPIGNDSEIAIKLDKDKLSILDGNSASSSAVAVIDNKGDASFSGTLSSNNLSVNSDASVSGTLHARKIIADEIEGLNIKASSVSANYITNVTNIYNSSGSTFPTLSVAPSNNNSNIFASLFANNNFINIATFSSSLAYVDNLNAANATFNNLNAFGPTTLSDTSVVGQLSVNGNLILSSESINVLGSDLNLQPLRQGGLSVMAGLFYIDTNGNVKVQGDVTVNGNLYANIISPIAGNDLSIKLGTSSAETGANLKVQDKNGQSVLSVSSVGDLVASGAATISKLNLSFVQPALAVSETEVIATGSAGQASIAAHKNEITIDNPLVTGRSLIYITPTSATGNQVLFLQRQINGHSFTVGIENQSQNAIPFNWIIVN